MRVLTSLFVFAGLLFGQATTVPDRTVKADKDGNVKIGTTVHSPATSEPACDASHRGQVVRVLGGAGAADTYRTCAKGSDDSYSWVSLGVAGGGTGDMVASTYITSGSGAPANPCTTAGAQYRDTSTTPYSIYFCPSAGGNWIGPAVMYSGDPRTIDLPGATSGATTLKAPDTGGGTTVFPQGSGTLSYTIASGAKALATAEIASLACTAAQTDTATGTLTTDVISWTPNASLIAVTGYAPAAAGGLTIYPFPTANTVNFIVCNPTASPVTPGAVTLNWRVVR